MARFIHLDAATCESTLNAANRRKFPQGVQVVFLGLGNSRTNMGRRTLEGCDEVDDEESICAVQIA
jgi:hypothetical protein